MRPVESSEVFCGEILLGLAAYFDSPFVANVARAVRTYPRPELANALNRKQLACKRWLVDKVAEAFGPRIGTVWVLGGWYGVLAGLMFESRRVEVDHIVSIDLDPACAEVAECLNRQEARRGAFRALTADMLSLDYAPFAAGGCGLIVNTSCEHLDRFDEWYASLPDGARLALQSNNYFSEPEHVNAVDSLERFAAQAPMARCLFAGALPMPRYARFMLIGEK